jgi:hypothetical protein
LAFQSTLDTVEEDEQNAGSVEVKWERIKKRILKTGEEKTGVKKLENREPWITLDVLDLIKERWKYKTSKKDEEQQLYETVRKTITCKARKVRKKWMNIVCKGVEDNLSQGKVRAEYRVVRSYFKEFHVKTNVIRSEGNEILIENEDKTRRWKECLEKLLRRKPLNSKLLEDEDSVYDMKKDVAF